MPQRKLRNYLLDRHFQLKYAGMVVVVTMFVASVLGYYAYHYSRGQTEALSVQMALQPDLHPDVQGDLRGWAEAQDRKVALAIIAGIAIMSLALGLTAIIITHRVVGPAYRLKKIFADVSSGHLKVQGSLRRKDELQDVFRSLTSMVEVLRERRKTQIQHIDQAIAMLQETSHEAKEHLQQLRRGIENELQ